MKTCGECAWFIPLYTYKSGGLRQESSVNGGNCRRCAWGGDDGDFGIGFADKRDRCCPAFEPVPVEIPDGHFPKCNECGKDFSRCNHFVMGFQFAPVEAE